MCHSYEDILYNCHFFCICQDDSVSESKGPKSPLTLPQEKLTLLSSVRIGSSHSGSKKLNELVIVGKEGINAQVIMGEGGQREWPREASLKEKRG